MGEKERMIIKFCKFRQTGTIVPLSFWSKDVQL